LDYFNHTFIKKFSNVTISGLLLTLVIINNPLHTLLIAVTLTIQTSLIFFIAYVGKNCQ